ncbi:MAG: hypothetical protein RL077_3713 [Verrucomicrobiota bacterium]
MLRGFAVAGAELVPWGVNLFLSSLFAEKMVAGGRMGVGLLFDWGRESSGKCSGSSAGGEFRPSA